MPNHVINMIEIEGDPKRIAELREAVKHDDIGPGSIDFDKVIPRPPELNIESGSRTKRGIDAVKDFFAIYHLNHPDEHDISQVPQESQDAFLKVRSDIDRTDWELGKQAYMNQMRYGAQTWYDWSIINWGTKWNGYGYGNSGYENSNSSALYCQTAWNAPHPIMERLAELYPDLTFTHKWADEDLGANCGRAVYTQGERVDLYIPEGKEALEFACKVWDYDLRELGYELNALGTDYVYVEYDNYQLADLFGKPALFTDEKITAADVPQGLYCYYVNSDVNGEPSEVSILRGDRFNGCVITDEPLAFNGAISLPIDEEHPLFFIGDDNMTMREYMNGEFDGPFNDVAMG